MGKEPGRPLKPEREKATKSVHLKVRELDWDLWERAALGSGAGSFSGWAKLILTKAAEAELRKR